MRPRPRGRRAAGGVERMKGEGGRMSQRTLLPLFWFLLPPSSFILFFAAPQQQGQLVRGRDEGDLGARGPDDDPEFPGQEGGFDAQGEEGVAGGRQQAGPRVLLRFHGALPGEEKEEGGRRKDESE